MSRVSKKATLLSCTQLFLATNGTCLSCRKGLDTHAENGSMPGLNIKEGGYSELLKTNVRNLIKIPNTLTPKDVAPLL